MESINYYGDYFISKISPNCKIYLDRSFKNLDLNQSVQRLLVEFPEYVDDLPSVINNETLSALIPGQTITIYNLDFRCKTEIFQFCSGSFSDLITNYSNKDLVKIEVEHHHNHNDDNFDCSINNCDYDITYYFSINQKFPIECRFLNIDLGFDVVKDSITGHQLVLKYTSINQGHDLSQFDSTLVLRETLNAEHEVGGTLVVN